MQRRDKKLVNRLECSSVLIPNFRTFDVLVCTKLRVGSYGISECSYSVFVVDVNWYLDKVLTIKTEFVCQVYLHRAERGRNRLFDSCVIQQNGVSFIYGRLYTGKNF